MDQLMYWMELLARMQGFIIAMVYVISTNDIWKAKNSEEYEVLEDSMSRKPFFNAGWLEGQNSLQVSPNYPNLDNRDSLVLMRNDPNSPSPFRKPSQ